MCEHKLKNFHMLKNTKHQIIVQCCVIEKDILDNEFKGASVFPWETEAHQPKETKCTQQCNKLQETENNDGHFYWIFSPRGKHWILPRHFKDSSNQRKVYQLDNIFVWLLISVFSSKDQKKVKISPHISVQDYVRRIDVNYCSSQGLLRI